MRWYHALFLLLAALPAQAQYSLNASVDRTAVRVGESVNLTLSFEGAGSGVPTPQLPPLENLMMAGGPSRSSSTSIINGRVSSSSSFTYVLRAQKPGDAQIGETSLIFKGRKYSTKPIALKIYPAGSNTTAGNSRGAGAQEVFLRVYPDKTEAYVGEQINISYKIFFSVQITNPEFSQLPKATGFWIEDIPMPKELPLSDEIVNGQSYKSAVIRRSALFPTTAGDLEVEPLVISTKIQRNTRRRTNDPFDIFNDPFFQMGVQMQPIEVVSPSVKIKAKPLPEYNAPTGFDGAVGQFRVRASFDRQDCKTDEAVTLTVEVEGTGNIKMLPNPIINFPPDLQSFAPEISDDIRRSQGRIQGKKIFKYVIIPRAPGIQVVSGWSYPFFDPDKGQYAVANAPELRLRVERGEGPSSLQPTVPVVTKKGVENIATDITFVKTQPGRFYSAIGQPHNGVGFWVFTGGPWAVLAGAMIFIRRRERLGGTVLARRRALKDAHRDLELAEKSLKSKGGEGMLRHLDGALDKIVFYQTGLSLNSSTTDEIEAAWRRETLDSNSLNELFAIRSECDLARFGAEHRTNIGFSNLLNRTKQTLATIGRNQSASKPQ
ncbi:MAG: BatD family protein [Calditrichota bacterium]